MNLGKLQMPYHPGPATSWFFLSQPGCHSHLENQSANGRSLSLSLALISVILSHKWVNLKKKNKVWLLHFQHIYLFRLPYHTIAGTIMNIELLEFV